MAIATGDISEDDQAYELITASTGSANFSKHECDETPGEYYQDADTDGHGAGEASACPGPMLEDDDQDSDSDGDGDGDGDSDSDSDAASCPDTSGWVDSDTDCDDDNADINPNAVEVCDTLDNDCDLLVDDADADIDSSTQDTFYSETGTNGILPPPPGYLKGLRARASGAIPFLLEKTSRIKPHLSAIVAALGTGAPRRAPALGTRMCQCWASPAAVPGVADCKAVDAITVGRALDEGLENHRVPLVEERGGCLAHVPQDPTSHPSDGPRRRFGVDSPQLHPAHAPRRSVGVLDESRTMSLGK